MSLEDLVKDSPDFVTVGLDIEQYRQLVDDLLGDLPTTAESILKRSLNATAKKVGRELAAQTQDRYRVKKIKFAKQLTYHLAKDNDLSADLVARGDSLPSSQFYTSPARPDKPKENGSRPVKLAVLKSTSPSMVSSPNTGLAAFLTRFASGHVAVVQRDPPATYTAAGWRVRKKKNNGYLKAAGKLDRTKIREFRGPSVPGMLEKTGVTEDYIDENRTKIQAYLENYIFTFLNREAYFAAGNGGPT